MAGSICSEREKEHDDLAKTTTRHPYRRRLHAGQGEYRDRKRRRPYRRPAYPIKEEIQENRSCHTEKASYLENSQSKMDCFASFEEQDIYSRPSAKERARRDLGRVCLSDSSRIER